MPKEKREKGGYRRKTNKTYPRPPEEQFVIGLSAAASESNNKTAKQFPNATLRQVRYYREKYEQDSHWNLPGGLRLARQKVSDATLATIIVLLSWVCDFNPGFSLQEYVELIYWVYGIEISRTWIQNVFSNLMQYSYRKLNAIQKAKFTNENITYYMLFLYWIQGIDCTRIVWIDESHFDSRTQKPRHGRGRKGKVINFVNNTSIQENFSLTALMRINSPIYFQIRYDSNDSWDFYSFMIHAFAFGHINPGDFVIFDNASVHSSTSMQLLDEFFTPLDIHLVRTPTYSPELNAIEKVFGYLKNMIYRGKARDVTMYSFLQREIPLVPQRNIVEWTRE
jgi:transposase